MKTFWAALLAFVVANVLLFLLTMMIFASITAFMGGAMPTVKEGSVLHIDLAGGISDSPSESPISSMDLFGGIAFDHSTSLYDALCAIDRAASDPKIKGIYLNLREGADITTLEELRSAVAKFKESGKFVVAYNEYYGQGDYYLSSVADKVYVHPEGGISWAGLSAQVMFFKGLLDKLGVEMQILRHGTFKSAVEPFMLKSMSEANRLQYDVMLNSIWGTIVSDIATSRGIDSLTLSNYASDLVLNTADDAKNYGLADGLMYEDQMMEMIKKLTEGKSIEVAAGEIEPFPTMKDTDAKEKDEGPEFISLADYVSATAATGLSTSKNKIAVIYADGGIVDGESSPGNVGGRTVMEKLAKARKDKDVKAVVLRVNSPGGSALASDLMWREVDLISKEKPIVVSMGSLAASGGYYISCAADAILADRTTLTGSIGVFGMMPYVGKFAEETLGLTVDVVKTNPSADMGSMFRKLDNREYESVMKGIKEVYSTFVGHVADGRNMTFEAVDKIGEGRVWSGANAIEIGLIDAFGGLKEAISLAVDRAGVADDFRVWEVVDYPDDLLSKLVSMGMINIESPGIVKGELGETFKHYNHVMEIVSGPSVQARLPYVIELNL